MYILSYVYYHTCIYTTIHTLICLNFYPYYVYTELCWNLSNIYLFYTVYIYIGVHPAQRCSQIIPCRLNILWQLPSLIPTTTTTHRYYTCTRRRYTSPTNWPSLCGWRQRGFRRVHCWSCRKAITWCMVSCCCCYCYYMFVCSYSWPCCFYQVWGCVCILVYICLLSTNMLCICLGYTLFSIYYSILYYIIVIHIYRVMVTTTSADPRKWLPEQVVYRVQAHNYTYIMIYYTYYLQTLYTSYT